MAPAVVIDNTPDLDMADETMPRTLILAPPSVASHPEMLTRVAEAYDRNATDIQMLDRLAAGLVALPDATYDIVLILTDVDQAVQNNSRPIGREAMERVVRSVKSGGRLRSHDGLLNSSVRSEAILAGLVEDADGQGMVKREASSAAQTVQLSFKKKVKANAAARPANMVEAAGTAQRTNGDAATGTGVLAANGVGHSSVAGVGLVDSNYDFGREDSEDEFPSNEELENAASIDPDTLLTEEDRQRPLVIPEACKPNSKRRRACKDCTCGLAQRLDAEDKAKRANADANLAQLDANDLNEVDFTIKGKVGSCGNCALGDAFRCDGCPYIGLPAFKPGEEVRLLNNDVQL